MEEEKKLDEQKEEVEEEKKTEESEKQEQENKEETEEEKEEKQEEQQEEPVETQAQPVEPKAKPKWKKPLIISLISVGSLLGAILLFVGSFLIYFFASYSRIGSVELEVTRNSTNEAVQKGKNYKAISYNIGFGAYSQDFTFFMDEGYDDEGNVTCGTSGKAKSYADVDFNTNGAINTVFDEKPDFVMFQEVDTNSTRSYSVNQYERIQNKWAGSDTVFCKNFHSAFIPLPIYDMMGTANSGLATVSKYQIQKAQRVEYTISDSFSKYFDLDRCFTYNVVDIEGSEKQLYIVNSHMSAYDEGGVIKTQQVLELNNFLNERKVNGDYVVVGGDWNHDLLTYNPDFQYTIENRPYGVTKRAPNWLGSYFDKDGKSPLIEGFNVVASDNVPSCRNNDITYQPGNTFVCTVDGFIVSDNIEVVSHRTIQTKSGKLGINGFAFSDHEPTEVEFKLL